LSVEFFTHCSTGRQLVEKKGSLWVIEIAP
jgi:hypothetical protein